MFRIVLIILPLVIIIFILEITLNFLKPTTYEKDDLLGWKLKKNFKHEFSNFTKKNKKYSTIFSTNKNGNLEFNLNGGYEKTIEILIIGDSFSTDPLVSNEKFWHSVMSKKISEINKININTTISGGGGYGTLQQLLISNKLQFLNPDIFILQFCINDFENNILDWEKKNYRFSQYFWRPYLDLDSKQIYYEKNIFKLILKPFKDSRLLSVFLSRSGFLAEKYFSDTIQNDKEMFESSLKTTKYLLQKIYQNFPLSKKIILNCKQATNFPDTEWKKIGNEIGYIVISENNKVIENAKNKNLDIFNIDGGHYNELGNKIFGEAIADEIEKRKLLSSFNF